MDTNTFTRLLNEAQTLRGRTQDPLVQRWLVGYVRGLEFTQYRGHEFGNPTPHEANLAMANSTRPLLRAYGAGYAAGLTGDPCVPPA
ncbi:MAG: hypothetical protein ACLPXB_00335 [Thiobacillaceae bacterium]